MAAWPGHMGSASWCVLYLLSSLGLLAGSGSALLCPLNCTCEGDSVDCSGLGLTDTPQELPVRTRSLNLSRNKLRTIDAEALSQLSGLRPRQTTCLPLFSTGSCSPSPRNHNKIQSIDGPSLQNLSALETLDLSNNKVSEVRAHCFPAGLRIRDLSLGSNRISYVEPGAFSRLSGSLQVLRLNRNRITQLPVKAFQLPQLTQLDLNRNRLRLIEGLTFQGLDGLEVLRLQRNVIGKLTDGAFWGLARIRVLDLQNNSLTEVNSGSLYGLSALLHLFLDHNSISQINPDGWKFCPGLRELSLSHNNLTRLDEGSLAVLGELQTLRLGHNSISHIAEGSFRGLRALRLLELEHNDISGTIEDTNGAFSGLDKFGTLFKSISLSAGGAHTCGVPLLGQAEKAFRAPPLRIQSDSFLCDCQLRWFPEWLAARGLQAGVEAVCAHPESLKGKSIFEVQADSFVCVDLPKPQITVQPETTVAVLGKDVRLTCTAASSSSSPMTFAWRKDQEFLREADVENFAHVRARDGAVMEYTTILHLRAVTLAHEGRYQCIITNHFGSSYSNKARLTVNVLPSFVKMPRDITIRMGATARLECAARGHPAPVIAWQKDGGTDFPAARERRMHVMPDDDVFFITSVKAEDMGVYSCTAQNTAGAASANATLTVLETPHLAQELEDRSAVVGETVALQCKALGSPPPKVTWLKGEELLRVTDRHHFTPGNQLLVIRGVVPEDAGRYTCVMSNALGTERAHSQLTVLHSAACGVHPSRPDSAVAVGIIVIAVVTSIVVTSLVWVCIIYQTRKKSEECSVTNTDETVVPPDVPSYLSSQGTLSDRQDVCIRVEPGSGPQPNGHLDGPAFTSPVVCPEFLENINSYSQDPSYMPEGQRAVDMGYLQDQHGRGCGQPRRGDAGPLLGQHCNGEPGGSRELHTSVFPSNHDRMTSISQYCDRKGLCHPVNGVTASLPLTTVCTTPIEESFHKPVMLGPDAPSSPDPGGESDLRQALISNGRPVRSCDSPGDESAPLRRAMD
uniref:Leucine rich repeats and immunoglobulin like domains 1 n=1 Tax=Paramormyrops kingsleyae TaxID=1676925 RepID=A0A3B3QJH9_9TELE